MGNGSNYGFEKLLVYQKAKAFAAHVYQKTGAWDKSHLYGLTDQFRRAAVSIALNIAEGSSRSRKDFSHFLTISYGSCFECLACLDIALELRIIDKNVNNSLHEEIESITKMLSGLKRSLKLTTKN